MAEPAFSVIVPVFRDWDRVPVLLAALAGQTFDDFELILVDNGPEPPAPPDLPPALRSRTRVLHCPRPGSYAARNAGAAEARGQVLAFTDADCRPAPGWLAAFAAAGGSGLLAGPVRVEPGPCPNRWEIYDALRGIPQEGYVRRGYATTANLCVPREVLRRLDGFDPARLSGGDAEFCRRAGAQGVPLALVPEAVVAHPARARRQEVETKARRIKGGQVAAGPRRRRLAWTIRSLTPPVREVARFLGSRRHPWRWRLVASGVRLSLWRVELAEVARLLTGGAPERR
ncbi:glycosyltransferase family 2 protein [Rubellimicrobium aerolatum]|uniref:Glycosyltransferase family 2 protein n=1 Tax=Rubellimicrobium aerolatum TaxID=490979 RepID=A0ABW0SBX9_9RHOB|nr:glycosyltransferase [Rubellimicrobium aerolatum]MBP1805949.1 hypothetical protein [Rubellimicrobium aerolatum]